MEGRIVNKVYLIGAGPGDPKLITVKGLELLKKCDVLIYDYLASAALLDHVGPDCKCIYVGKQAGKHYKTQDEINEILVEYGKKYECVVRLKGGDPFVFGRGGEEVEALKANGIPFEVVPGVTSAVAVPECAGIPVTHRGVARSFHVITGHTKTSKDYPEYDYDGIAKMEGTLVFLMGLSSLEKIAQELIKAGKAMDTPTAVISSGTMPKQQVVRASLKDIAKQVKEAGVSSPGIIVIGAVADYAYIDDQMKKPLVGITATESLRKKLEHGFERLGWRSLPICNMEICPTVELKGLGEELTKLQDYSWVIFTSQNAVRLFFEQVQITKIDLRRFSGIRFAALGSGTAACLLEYGFSADFVPRTYTVECLTKELIPQLHASDRLLIPRAVQGSKLLTEEFDKNSVDYKEFKIYDVQGKLTDQVDMLQSLDYLVFVSASGVDAFFTEIKQQEIAMPEHVKIGCIGQITKTRVEKRYKDPDVIATECDVQGLLRALEQDKKV